MTFRLSLIALIVTMTTPPAHAGLRRDPGRDRSPFADYVRARAADDLGQLDLAAQGFAAALDDNPGDTLLALRTMRQAVAAGDMVLAVRTARALDQRASLPPDGTLLLVSDAIAAKDWKRAVMLCDRIRDEKLFAFLAPVIRAWLATATHGDPQTLLDQTPPSPLGTSYAAEHRVLLLVAQGNPGAGAAALDALALPDGARAARLRIAVAATLQKRGKANLASTVLTGADPAIARGRDILAAGGRLPGAIDTPQAGVAELFARVAADVNREHAGTLATEFAQMATMLAPAVSEGWLVSASLLAGAGDTDAALAALARIGPDDPFIGAARDARLTLLARLGRTDEALAEADAVAHGPQARAGDWARYADLLTARTRPTEAAAAYARALDLAGGIKASPDVAWPLLLQQGNAQLEAGDWPGAKASAERALALAPQQPAILNFLGYSELEHGTDAATAAAMIAQASLLAPDDPSITDSLGWSWYVRGDVARAIPLLEQAARGAPAETDINDHLGDAYWRAGRRLEARYSWRAALVDADSKDMARIRGKLENGVTARP